MIQCSEVFRLAKFGSFVTSKVGSEASNQRQDPEHKRLPLRRIPYEPINIIVGRHFHRCAKENVQWN